MTWWAKFKRDHLFAPNGLSLLRGVLGAFLPFLILRPEGVYHLIAVLLFPAGAITDYWDGVLARRRGLESDFGKLADPAMDKILILAPLAAFSARGFFSFWWLVPIFAREITVTFCRIGWLLEGKAVGAEKLGKIKFGFQVVTVGVGLVYLLAADYSVLRFLESFTRAFLFLSLLLSVLLTLVSGISFALNNSQNFLSGRFAQFTSAAGVGLIPFVPGTLGSVLGLGLVALTHFHAGLYLAVLGLLVWVGWWAVSRLDLSKEKDPHFVVIDEVCGMFIPFLGVPLTFFNILAGFFLFRLFDVIKPFPVRRLEALPGYWGILLDDIGAGIYAWLILFLFFR